MPAVASKLSHFGPSVPPLVRLTGSQIGQTSSSGRHVSSTPAPSNSTKQFTRLLAWHGIRQSLSRPQQVWDSAVVESFYSTLKVELIHRHAWPTRAQARQAVFEFVEVLSGYAGALVARIHDAGRLRGLSDVGAPRKGSVGR